jgi:hypothetical protein
VAPRKSQRASKPATIWEEKQAPPAALDPKNNSSNARTKPETALKPIPTGPLLDSTKFDRGHLRELPDYSPPLILLRKPSESIATCLSILETFQLFVTQAMVAIIVVVTNGYAASVHQNREERKPS